MVNYECDYSEENSLQTRKQEIENAPVVPRINRHLLREGEQFGVCSGGAVLCDNRSDLSLANPCSRRRVARILPERAGLIVWCVAGIGTAGNESNFQAFGETLGVTPST